MQADHLNGLRFAVQSLSRSPGIAQMLTGCPIDACSASVQSVQFLVPLRFIGETWTRSTHFLIPPTHLEPTWTRKRHSQTGPESVCTMPSEELGKATWYAAGEHGADGMSGAVGLSWAVNGRCAFGQGGGIHACRQVWAWNGRGEIPVQGVRASRCGKCFGDGSNLSLAGWNMRDHSTSSWHTRALGSTGGGRAAGDNPNSRHDPGRPFGDTRKCLTKWMPSKKEERWVGQKNQAARTGRGRRVLSVM
ncbi:hypothetical protein C8R44DRAFT_727404 [Mycena epipterygia]|nr:hypothetical protein C8R44DRAFT_727404 [Mycena epipterygia]